MTKSERKFIFSINPGHVGSTFLAEMLGENLPDANMYHEIIGYENFGVDTPEVSHFTLFNSKGNVQKVRDFWDQKITRILDTPIQNYGEMSHLLAKAGLMENIQPFCDQGEVYIIVLKRKLEKIILSMAKRFDMLNVGNMWMWHLDPQYPLKIVESAPFYKAGVDGLRFWYACEMYSRAEYYRALFKDNGKVTFIDVEIDTLSDTAIASKLLADLGFDIPPDKVVLPERKNVSTSNIDANHINFVNNLVKNSRFDPKIMAMQTIEKRGTTSFWNGIKAPQS
jgi:hypothetical protein